MSECCGPSQDACVIARPCPQCGAVGHEVARETVGAMATLEVPAAALSRATYRYCGSETCPVVYYGDGGAIVERQHVRVPVNAKDPGLDVPLCYCFGHTRRTIAEEIAATDQSTAFATITREIKAGHCACEVKNPSGRCCLGDVRAYQKHVISGRQRGGATRGVSTVPQAGRRD